MENTYEIQNKKEVKKMIKRVILGIVIFLGAITLFSSFAIITAGKRGVVLNFGAVSNRIMEEGFNFKIPYFQTVKKLDITIQKEEVMATAASKDLQTVSTKIALNYHISANQVNILWQSVRGEYKSVIIDPAIQEAIKASTAKYTAEELITKRSEVKDVVKLLLSERLAREFIIVDELSIVDFDFSKSFNDAIEAKVTAEQSALAAKNKLEQVKFEAEQRITQAKGEAEAIRIQAQAIQNQGGAAYVNLKAIEKWDGKTPIYMLGESIPFLNIK
jgi:regulator of protease activity HflC (stomatin/prohibitin superfamily)